MRISAENPVDMYFHDVQPFRKALSIMYIMTHLFPPYANTSSAQHHIPGLLKFFPPHIMIARYEIHVDIIKKLIYHGFMYVFFSNQICRNYQ